MSALYDQIGRQYRATRAADPRIVQHLVDFLSLTPGATLCDVGAGSGNYTNALAACGYKVFAVEPAEVMRRQAAACDGVSWLDGIAEKLPLPDHCADGVVCTLAAHHFKSLSYAAAEMNRVCPKGPLVFFTLDPRVGDDPWFANYFPEIREKDYFLFPPLSAFAEIVGSVTGRSAEIYEFVLPADLTDRFMYAPWNRPDVYLDPIFRANTSGFAGAEPSVVERGLVALRKDLETGVWDERNGHLRSRSTFDAGFRFVAFRGNH